jgi:hypothetical protein
MMNNLVAKNRENMNKARRSQLQVCIITFIAFSLVLQSRATVKGVNVESVIWCGLSPTIENCAKLDKAWFEKMLNQFATIKSTFDSFMVCWDIEFPANQVNNLQMANNHDIDSGKLKVLLVNITLINDPTRQRYVLRAVENQPLKFHLCIPLPNMLDVKASWWGIDAYTYAGGLERKAVQMSTGVEAGKNAPMTAGTIATALTTHGIMHKVMLPNNTSAYELYAPGTLFSNELTSGIDLFPGVPKKLAMAMNFGGTFFEGVRAGEKMNFYLSSAPNQQPISALFGSLPPGVSVNNFDDLMALIKDNPEAYDTYLNNAVDVSNKVVSLMNFTPIKQSAEFNCGFANLTQCSVQNVLVSWKLNIPQASITDAFFGTKTGNDENKLLLVTFAMPSGIYTRVVGSSKSGINWEYIDPCIVSVP